MTDVTYDPARYIVLEMETDRDFFYPENIKPFHVSGKQSTKKRKINMNVRTALHGLYGSFKLKSNYTFMQRRNCVN